MTINNSSYIRDLEQYQPKHFNIAELFDYSPPQTAKEYTLEDCVEEFGLDSTFTKRQIFEKFGLKDGDLMTADLIRYSLDGNLHLFYKRYAVGIVTDLLKTQAGRDKIGDMFYVYSKHLDIKKRVEEKQAAEKFEKLEIA
tara:strand:+ start:134 stop:553 length:420 start_codon:yes stop_codon:yes gene_type:complete